MVRFTGAQKRYSPRAPVSLARRISLLRAYLKGKGPISLSEMPALARFSELVDWKRFSVLNPPGYVFLCGASLACKETSLRAQFHDQKVKNNPDLHSRIKLAEDANRWYRANQHFSNLLELEEYLAGLSSCVLLFVESPGAIAELGAFTQMQTIREKLLIVLEQSYSVGPSFIVDGPIEQMKNYDPDSVHVYPWLLHRENESELYISFDLLKDTLDSISEDLQSKLQKIAQKSLFRENDHGHKMLLLADLVNLLVITNQQELQAIVKELSINFREKEVYKYLYLLRHVGLISSKTYRAVDYFFSNEDAEHIHYAPKSPMDRLRLRDVLRVDFPITADKLKALKAHQAQLKEAQ